MWANAEYIYKGVIYSEVWTVLQQITAVSSKTIELVFILSRYCAP
jgi:hypothetical protein